MGSSHRCAPKGQWKRCRARNLEVDERNQPAVVAEIELDHWFVGLRNFEVTLRMFEAHRAATGHIVALKLQRAHQGADQA